MRINQLATALAAVNDNVTMWRIVRTKRFITIKALHHFAQEYSHCEQQ
jgi:hypothetical protein